MSDLNGLELDEPMIVNWALAELGLAPTFTIDDHSGTGTQVAVFWPRAVARCFGLHDWTFCRRTNRLSRQTKEPETGYRYGFELPGDRIGEPVKLLSDPRNETPIRNSRIEGNVVYADEEAVYAVCKVRLDPRVWDWQFADAFAVALAAYLAIPLTQDPDLAAEKAAQAFGTRSEGGAGGVFGRLIAQNRAAGPVGSPLMQDDPLTAGRFSGNWHGRY